MACLSRRQQRDKRARSPLIPPQSITKTTEIHRPQRDILTCRIEVKNALGGYLINERKSSVTTGAPTKSSPEA
jgi:hypothetical protein